MSDSDPPRIEHNCPSCHAPMASGAVLCVECGYDTRTHRSVKRECCSEYVTGHSWDISRKRYRTGLGEDGTPFLEIENLIFVWRTQTRRFNLQDYEAIYTDYRLVKDWASHESHDEFIIELSGPGGGDTIKEVMYSEKDFAAVIDLLREYANLELRRG